MKRCLLVAILLVWLGEPNGAAEAADYRLAPGDVVEVTVAPQHSFDRTLTIQPDGKISYPLVGTLQATGLSGPELAEKLRARLNDELVDPEVTVSLKEVGKQGVPRASLLGAVRNPGAYEVKAGTTVLEVLALGGGPTSLADLRRVTITRTDGAVLPIDLAPGEQQPGSPRPEVGLRPGDLIFVPEGTPPMVLVLGEVARAGSYPIQRGARLLDALTLAGGPTPKADLGRVVVTHAVQGGARSVDLAPLLAGDAAGEAEQNPPLQPGDTIVIAETLQRVYILGRVVKPDIYPIRPNDRILDGLAKAGGATSDGNLAGAVLVRRDAKGQPLAKPLDVSRIMKGNLAENDLLRPGDVLYIPDKKTRRSPLELLFPLTGLLSLLK